MIPVCLKEFGLVRAVVPAIFAVAAACVGSLGVAVSAANAQVTFTGDTTGGPVWNRTAGLNALSGVGTATPYQTLNVRITDPVAFAIEVTTAPFDTYLHLYQGAFNPTDQFNGLVASNDDGGVGLLSRLTQSSAAGPLTAGDYILVVNGFGNLDFGPYSLLLTDAFPLFGAFYEDDLKIMGQSLTTLLSGFTQGGLSSAMFDAHQARMRMTGNFSTSGPTSVDTASGIVAGRFHAFATLGHRRSFGDGPLDSSGEGGQIGLDYAINERLAIGFTVGGAQVETESATSSLDGTAIWVQPYISYIGEVGGGLLRVLASLEVHSLDVDFTDIAGNGSADALGIVGRIEVAHRHDLSGGFAVTPYARLSAGNTGFSDYTNILIGAAAISTRTFEVDGGVELSADLGQALGLFGQAYLRAELQYRNSNAPTSGVTIARFDADGLSAGLAAGVSVSVTEAITLSLEASGDAIGSDLANFGASARISSLF